MWGCERGKLAFILGGGNAGTDVLIGGGFGKPG